jgi:single-strand DNA-binding protein
MRMYLKLIVVGFVGKDPEMRFTPGGQPVTSFSVACNRKYKDAGGQTIEEVAWFKVSVWNAKQAEACKEYLHKGSMVLVEGRLACDKTTGGPRTWKGNDGEMRTSFEVNAENVRFLGGGRSAEGGEPAAAAATGPGVGIGEDEIPF